MKILAADTATSFNCVAVCEFAGDPPTFRVLAETAVDAGRKHSERLLETVDWVLGEAGHTLSDMGLLAISVGPGSFTGLRVGTAAWKGLALAADLPLVGVPTLDALARLNFHPDGIVCPMLDAKMSEVFAAIYRHVEGARHKLGGDRVLPPEEFLDLVASEMSFEETSLFLGDGARLYESMILDRFPKAHLAQGNCSNPRASAVALEAAELFESGASADGALVTPVYLRKSQAEESRDRAKAEAAAP